MGKRGRTVSNRPDDDCVDALLALMRTEQAKARYKRRAPIAEFSNVSIKTKLNWERLRSRCVKRGAVKATWPAPTDDLQRYFAVMRGEVQAV